MNNREALATNIKLFMKRADIRSQAQFARVAGVSQTQIGNILGQRKAASIDLVERLAAGLGCEPWLLLAPVALVKEYGGEDFAPLVYNYLRLNQKDQDAVWDLAHDLNQDKT